MKPLLIRKGTAIEVPRINHWITAIWQNLNFKTIIINAFDSDQIGFLFQVFYDGKLITNILFLVCPIDKVSTS